MKDRTRFSKLLLGVKTIEVIYKHENDIICTYTLYLPSRKYQNFISDFPTSSLALRVQQ